MTEQEFLAWLAAARRGESTGREKLIAYFRPFIRRVAMQASRRPLKWENDDELSIALIAFNEAIDTYDPTAGGFLSHARRVIGRRLIDYFRREGRHRYLLSLDAPVAAAEEEQRPSPLERERAWQLYNDAETIRSRAEEIQAFSARLAEYGLTLADLKASAPKHRDTRQRLTEIARHLASDYRLAGHLQRTRQLPLKELERATGASRKVLESGRRYIVALAILLMDDEFEHLRSFAGLLGSGPFGEGGAEGG